MLALRVFLKHLKLALKIDARPLVVREAWDPCNPRDPARSAGNLPMMDIQWFLYYIRGNLAIL